MKNEVIISTVKSKKKKNADVGHIQHSQTENRAVFFRSFFFLHGM